MTATVSREITVTYAGLTVGGTSDVLLDRFYRLRKSEDSFEISFRVAVVQDTGTTDAQFATACLAVETAFRTPRGTLSLVFNASTHISLTDGTTAYGIRATCEKAGDEDGPDSRRARLYIVTIAGGLPADLMGTNNLRRMTWTVDWSPARQRTITIEGVYTRNGATGSFAQYSAQIGTRSASVITAAGGGTFEVDTERATPDTFDDETSFSIVWREVIFSQSSGALDDADIVRQALSIRRSRVGPGDTPTVKRLQRIVIAYQAFIDKENTQDLRSKWTNTIRPWLISNARTFSGSGTIALVSDEPDFGPDENRISATLEFLATTGTGILSQTVTTRDDRDRAKITRKQWAQVGDADAYKPPKARVILSPVTIRRTVTTTQEVLGAVGMPGPPTPQAGAGGNAGNALGVFGIGQQIGFTINGQSGNALGIFGIGQAAGFAFSPGALSGSGTPGGRGAGGAGGQAGGPQWVRVGVPSLATTPIRYGQDGTQFDVTRVESVDIFEFLDVDTSQPAPSTTGGNAAGGPRSAVPRTT